MHDAVAMGVFEASAGLGDDVERQVEVEMAAVAQDSAHELPGTCSMTMKC